MSINLNPTYSPVWRWLRDHALALLGVVTAAPHLVTAVGVDPQTAAVWVGVATALGALGKHYAKDPVK